ncbi:MAG: alkaline phosphatase D family protein, partial [Deltaproteobacteria bacterium]|nr:alkaline phosphatase D family protein [Deltaproteobacteria bacterium]
MDLSHGLATALAILALAACGTSGGRHGEDAADDPDVESDWDAGGDADVVEETPAADAEEELPPEDPCNVYPERYDGGETRELDPWLVTRDDDLFPLTVQAGSMTSDGAILWGYASNSSVKRIVVWRDVEEEGFVAVVWDVSMIPAEGYMKELVEGLAPGTWYHYAFFEDGGDDMVSRSVIGRFRTALHAECSAPITIAGTHGTNLTWAPYTALDITARYDIDAFFQLGDFSYNDGCETLDEFRALWRMTLSDPGYMALLPRTGQYIVWDDHEIEDDADLYRDIVENPALIAAGKDAFFETTPVPRYENNSYWRSYKWGRTAEMFLLDCRHERQPGTRLTEDAIYIG